MRFSRTTRIGSWIALNGENIIRLVDLDNLSWDLSGKLCDHRIAYCHSGGPVALYFDSWACNRRAENVIQLYSATGGTHPTTSGIPLSGMEGVLFMFWGDHDDKLFVVLNTGAVRVFNLRGECVALPIQLLAPLLCIPTGNGIALLVREPSFQLVLIENNGCGEYDTDTMKLPISLRQRDPRTMLAIPRQRSDSGQTELFIPFSFNEKSLTVYHCIFGVNSQCYDIRLSVDGGDVVHMALSPSAQHIAFLTEDGNIYVASRSFDDITRLHNINTEVIPAQFLWCGDNCITYLHLSNQFDTSLEFPTTMTLVNASDCDQCEYLSDVPTDAFLVPDCDGIRIFSSKSYQFLQVVAEPSRRIFSVGSRANSAMLLLAFDEFLCGNSNSVKIIRDLQKDPHALSEAVDDCVLAAGSEFDISQQKRLMRVAAFGKSFCPMYEYSAFVNMARRLRTMNALRKSKLGMLVSHAQLSRLEGERLVERLIALDLFQLAYHICDSLGLATSGVIERWAVAKIMNSSATTDAEKEAAYNVVDKLKNYNRVNFSEIAHKIYQKHKANAALILLGAERIASRQIPKLLEIDQAEVALRQAVKIGDADLLFTTMMFLINTKGEESIDLLTCMPDLRNLLFFYASACDGNRNQLLRYLSAYPEYCAYINVLQYLRMEQRFLRESESKTGDWEVFHRARVSTIRSVAASMKSKSASHFSSNGKWLRLHAELLEEQSRLARELNDRRFLNASVLKTITLCHEHGRKETAERMRNNFNVTDKMNCWSMLNGFASASKWDLIDQLGDARGKTRPVIGGAAFVTTLLAHGRVDQAKQYIPKVKHIESRMEYYVLFGEWSRAGADCRQNSELEILEQLKERAKGNELILQQIEEGWNSVQESGAIRLARLFA
ncbi:Vps16 N terminal region Vps16 C terminal region [Trypanosoma vivax]|uniref:Putative vacuolar protein sorting complex subunit (Putative vps16) n=1 Tax=Trypanosoma vivax (strain Y486) TaxID=1055687 RepID=G0U462_TRYVY|nr:putative Vps16 [Trypanosoma vivax]KAH8611826.1 Vps16 N terminal region Vps16 C terminal region [Trypanosoma vivax]CCC52224.1 putative Vps16 [Trypanosoma vivax Y486]